MWQPKTSVSLTAFSYHPMMQEHETHAPCRHCNETFKLSGNQRQKLRAGQTIYCSRACYAKASTVKVPIRKACSQCGVEFELNHTQNWKHVKGHATSFFCSKACTTTNTHQTSEQMMAWNSSPEKADGMRAAIGRSNWLQTPESVEKNRLKRIASGVHKGRALKVQGGNGRPLSAAHQAISDALGSSWANEHAVRTGMPRGSGYPPAYKLDLANPLMKLGIEVDGKTHKARAVQALDAKKTALLSELGWKVLRFSNEEVMANLAGCVEAVLSMTSQLRATTISSPKES
jgi:Protein of unknown function (DUF559)